MKLHDFKICGSDRRLSNIIRELERTWWVEMCLWVVARYKYRGAHGEAIRRRLCQEERNWEANGPDDGFLRPTASPVGCWHDPHGPQEREPCKLCKQAKSCRWSIMLTSTTSSYHNLSRGHENYKIWTAWPEYARMKESMTPMTHGPQVFNNMI